MSPLTQLLSNHVTIFEHEIINNKTFEPAGPIFIELWAFTNEIIFNTCLHPLCQYLLKKECLLQLLTQFSMYQNFEK